jgi:hypothetical protein
MNNYLLYPSNYKKSTQVTFFTIIAKILNLESIDYDEFYVKFELSIKDKILVIILFGYFSILSVFKFNRKSISIFKVNLSHPLIETYLKEFTEYNFKKDFRFYRQLLKAIKILLKIKKNVPKIGLLIGGDEAYLFGSIYGQVADIYEIPNIYFKDFGTLSGFKFNREKLYSGIINYKKLYKTNLLEIPNLESELNDLVASKIDYHYMKKRDFSQFRLYNHEQNQKCIILYLHDFIDSPGVFGDSVFMDIPSWVKFCLESTKNKGYRILIKTHPNALPINEVMVKKLNDEIVSKYTHAEIIKNDFSLVEISKQLKVYCVLTVFGSVIYEAAYLGINVISCGNAPANFFEVVSKNARTKSELKFYLDNIIELDDSEKELLKTKAIKAYSAYKYFIKQSEILEIPYDYLKESIKQKIFDSKLDPQLELISTDIWQNSIRVENYVREVLQENNNWLTKVKETSGYYLKLIND